MADKLGPPGSGMAHGRTEKAKGGSLNTDDLLLFRSHFGSVETGTNDYAAARSLGFVVSVERFRKGHP